MTEVLLARDCTCRIWLPQSADDKGVHACRKHKRLGHRRIAAMLTHL